MVFQLRIDTENDAFAGGISNEEISRKLREVAELLETREPGDIPAVILRDSNGNRVGFFCLGNPGEPWNFGSDAGRLPALLD